MRLSSQETGVCNVYIHMNIKRYRSQTKTANRGLLKSCDPCSLKQASIAEVITERWRYSTLKADRGVNLRTATCLLLKLMLAVRGDHPDNGCYMSLALIVLTGY